MSRLLIVDDERDVRDFSRSFFQKRGVTVDVAADGTEALARMADAPPDLILLDLRMKGLSGLDVLRRMREQSLPFPVIMISGGADDEVVRECAAFGALAFIHKPLVLDELKSIVLSRLGGAAA